MSQEILVIAADLGTSTTTASFVRVRQFFGSDGQERRERCGNIVDIRDWPGGLEDDSIGKVCLPTEVVYSKASRRLLYWGFVAQQYLDDPSPEIKHDEVYVVQHIKLLLSDPDETRVPTAASDRYRAGREKLKQILGKHPYEVFTDFMTEVTEHVIGSANNHYYNGIHSCQLELVLAFPSGWDDSIHTKVAEISGRALEKAFVKHNLPNIVFGIENVYTVSETLCGVKEWLRNTIAEARPLTDYGHRKTNLDELNEGDCFLPIDIGGGTGCMTPLRLVSKDPLRVDQLGPTRSLEVSGEAVEAEFKQWLQPLLTNEEYPGDVSQIVNQICRRFREAKKNCGLPLRPGSFTWNVPVPGLKRKKAKGFEKDCMKIDWGLLDRCFDPVINTLESAIKQALHKMIDIKAIVFLGQFGGRSSYLRKRLARNNFGSARLRYSPSGKLDVVKGAISERLTISSSFVRKWGTLKSYGTLIALEYYTGSEAQKMFPNAAEEGAVKWERGIDGDNWLKVIEWAIAKGTAVEKDHAFDIGKDGPRYHTWEHTQKVNIEFEDTIIVSDELPPAPQYNGKSYTLWTEAHEQNELIINNQRIHVRQIPFSWDITMSRKVDPTGHLIGPYGKEDLKECWYPAKERKNKRRKHLRKLDYELLWHITEMQLKVHVRALFPNPIGPLTVQLAKERRLDESEKGFTGESRSNALIRDIEISAAVDLVDSSGGVDDFENRITQETLTTTGGPSRPRLSGDQGGEYQHIIPTHHQSMSSPTRDPLLVGWRSINDSVFESPRNTSQPLEGSGSNTLKLDRRRRDGCYTCKNRRKKCDCVYTFDVKRGSQSCRECNRFKIDCHITEPDWATKDPERLKREQAERKKMVKLGKRKARE